MKIIRIYTTVQGESQFEEIELPLFQSEFGSLSEKISSQSIMFGEMDEPADIGWHNAPCRQFVIMLQGAMEIEITAGIKKTLALATLS